MVNKSRKPESPIDVSRAREHGIFAVNKAWIVASPGFEGWATTELSAEPLVLYDLNGKELFYEFDVLKNGQVIGSTKTSASKTLASPVPTIEYGPRGWDPKKSIELALVKVKERFPEATIGETELVCYSYPKIGVRVYLKNEPSGLRSAILDVSDLSFIEAYGADENEGATSWSFYEVMAAPNAVANKARWEQSDQELEEARSISPQILEGGVPADAREGLNAKFMTQFDLSRSHVRMLPFFSSREIKYSPRCKPHDCFQLYAQKTNVYCAVATGQMILDFYRYYFTQDEIANAMNTGSNGTTNPNQVNGYQALSKGCLVATFDSTANWREAKTEIDANRPLKSGIPGHARACAGWKQQNIYHVNAPRKRWLKIYDPWPWNSNICAGGKVYWEDWDAVTHTNFIYVRHRTTSCS